MTLPVKTCIIKYISREKEKSRKQSVAHHNAAKLQPDKQVRDSPHMVILSPMSSLANKPSCENGIEQKIGRKFLGKTYDDCTSCRSDCSQCSNKDKGRVSSQSKHQRKIIKFYNFLKWRSKHFTSETWKTPDSNLPKKGPHKNSVSQKFLCSQCHNSCRDRTCLGFKHGRLKDITEKPEVCQNNSQNYPPEEYESRQTSLLNSLENDTLSAGRNNTWQMTGDEQHLSHMTIGDKDDLNNDYYSPPHSEIVALRQNLRASWRSEEVDKRKAPNHLLPIRSDLILKQRNLSDSNFNTDNTGPLLNWLEVENCIHQSHNDKILLQEKKLRKAPWLRNLHFLPK